MKASLPGFHRRRTALAVVWGLYCLTQPGAKAAEDGRSPLAASPTSITNAVNGIAGSLGEFQHMVRERIRTWWETSGATTNAGLPDHALINSAQPLPSEITLELTLQDNGQMTAVRPLDNCPAVIALHLDKIRIQSAVAFPMLAKDASALLIPQPRTVQVRLPIKHSQNLASHSLELQERSAERSRFWPRIEPIHDPLFGPVYAPYSSLDAPRLRQLYGPSGLLSPDRDYPFRIR